MRTFYRGVKCIAAVSLFMSGFYAGRFSIAHKWLELVCVVGFWFSTVVYGVVLWREHVREERTFDREMQRIAAKYEKLQ